MKHTRPEGFLTRAVLACVRDEAPSPAAFAARFGEACFHVLRKSGVIAVEGNSLRLNPHHLTSDGTRFLWKNRLIHLDADRIDIVCSKRDVPPGEAEDFEPRPPRIPDPTRIG